MVESLAGPRPEEEGLTEAEAGPWGDTDAAHAGIRNGVRVDGRARPGFMSERKVAFVEAVVGEGGDEIEVESLDVGRALDAVCRVAVGRDIKGLVGITRIVEVIGAVEEIFLVEVVVDAAEEGSVVNDVIDGLALLLIEG